MFTAFLGNPHHTPAWRQSAEEHARWLGLRAEPDTRPVSPGVCFAFAWLLPGMTAKPALSESAGYLRLRTAPATVPTEADDNLISIEVAVSSGQIRVTVPPTTPEPFYAAHDQRGWLLGNDLRLLRRWVSADLDERGLYAWFQYGAIPAPLTLARQLRYHP